MSYSLVTDPAALDAALALARGCYQRDLLRGVEALSGATLRGVARRYAGRYARSRRALLSRLTCAGIPHDELRGEHCRRILVVGPTPLDARAEATSV